MSKENVEVVGRLNAAVIRDVEQGLREHWGPDAVWDMGAVPGWPGQAEYLGPEGFLRFLDEWTAPYDEWYDEVETVTDAGRSKVAAKLYQRGKMRGSDSFVELRYGMVYTVENGAVRRAQVYTTPEAAFQAAGLMDPAALRHFRRAAGWLKSKIARR